MSNIIDKIQLSGVTYDIGGSGGGTVSSAITSGDTNAVAGGAVYDKFDEVEQVTAQALNVLNDRLDEDEEVTAAALNTLNESLSGKQDTLSAGTNITIVDNVISAEGGSITIDPSLDTGSTNPVANSAITTSLNDKANKSAAYGSYVFGESNSKPWIRYRSVSNGYLGNEIYYAKINGKGIFTNNSTWAGNNLMFSLIETSAITTSVTSASTDSQVPSAKAVYDAIQEGGGGGTVESAITSGSTNAVESKAIWSATTYNKEITLQWDNGFPSKLSTNYPSGCKKFVVTVPSNNTAVIILYNGESPISGSITISNYSSPSVSIVGYDGTTYTISGNDVTFVIPNTITFDQLQTDTRRTTSIKAIVEGAWIADNTYMKSEVDVIQNTLQNNINQKLDSTAYTPVTIDSTLIENSTNPVEGGVLYDELIYKGAASETTIEWSGNDSANYPSGCTEIKVEVSGSNNGMTISFYDDNWQSFGNVNINNWGSISVYFNDLQGATYEISGTTVTISYPSVTGVTILRSNGMVTYTTKAVTYGASTTVKDALGGLKFVKLTQTEYDNLQTKDNNTLYVIVN